MESYRILKFKRLLKRVEPLLEKCNNTMSQLPNNHSDLHSRPVINYPEDSFKSAISFPIFINQYLCLSPMSESKFNWFSYRVILSLIICVLQVIMTILSIIRLQNGGLSIFKSGSVLFFGGAALAMLLLIRVSMKWPKMISHWEQVEGYIGEHKYLKLKFKIISIFITFSALVRHFTYLLSGLSITSYSIQNAFKIHMINKFPQVYNIISYNIWNACVVLFINTISILLYCFIDQVIVMLSLALGEYFHKFNKTIMEYKRKTLQPAEWKTLRMNYIRLCTLTAHVNDCICHLLCLTFLLHVYIFCVNMNQGILKRKHYKETLHFLISFSVSTIRIIALCLTTVRVYEQSKTPLTVMFNVPHNSYCSEVELFTHIIINNNVCLTGSHVFSMTRNFLLTIAGTIITFELLLIQLKEYIANI